ncbi:MAG TPA: PQQ-binding-like beta-propeller repeat protein [Pirellulales bacterium]|nr:PQQ-binding-like beta-propeller repeat protein [Pirellulales bacterium]
MTRFRFSSVVWLCLVSLAGSFAARAVADDWPGFRGPHGLAVSPDTGLPVTWSDEQNIAWKRELPGPGSSSPIVVGKLVFLTCYSGYGLDKTSPGDQTKLERNLVCVDVSTGRILWQKSVAAALPEDSYGGMLADHGYASHTAATDGERVYAFFGKSGVVAFDLDGNQLWQQKVGTRSDRMRFGSGASLCVYKNLVIVNASIEGQAIYAFDGPTGRQVWKTDAEGYGGSYSTPVVVDVGKKAEIVVNMPDEIWGLDPQDGGLFWYSSSLRGASNTTVVARDGIVFALAGGPGGSGAVAIRAGGQGDVTQSRQLWKKSIGSYVPSPVVLGEYLYWVDDKGIAYCVNASSGEQVYRERLAGLGGGGRRGASSAVYASVVAADGKLYAVSRHNGTFVLAQGPKFELLAHNEFESDPSDFNASPAVVQGRLLLRSDRALYCVGPGFSKISRTTNPVILSK